MPEPLPEQILRKIDEAAGLYHRLVLVVGPSGSGKTAALRAVSERTGFPCINVGLELSRRLLDLAERQRPFQVPRLLGHVVGVAGEQIVLLDNTEILFDITLQQDPLRSLQGLARTRTVVAAWNGRLEHGRLVHAIPDHPEYRHYPIADLVIASPEAPA